MSAFVRRQYGVLKSFLLGIFLALMALTSASFGLTELNDSALEDVQGAGLAFAFDDFRFQMEPTSFFENIGSVPNRGTGLTNAFKGDYRWIGTTISRGYQLTGTGAIDYNNLFGYSDYVSGGNFVSSPTTHAGMTAAAAQAAALEYKPAGWSTGDPMQTLSFPIATGGAQGYAEINNPFVIRVHTYGAVGLSCTPGAPGCSNPRWATGKNMTVLELVGATHSSPFRWAFWGEVDSMKDSVSSVLSTVPRDNAYYTSYLLGRMTNQEIIIGSPTSRFKPDGSNPAGDGTGIEIGCSGSGTGTTGCGNAAYKIMGPVFRMYQSMGSANTGGTVTNGNGSAVGGGNNDQTLGMLYLHRLSGDYRFSVNQLDATGVTAGSKVIPKFDLQEGMYFMNVNAYLPMGQLHYQSLVVSGVKSGNDYTGDFVTETSLLPNDPYAYNDFYGYPGNLANTTPPAGIDNGFIRSGRKDRYYETHGYVRWGDNFPTAAEFITGLGNTGLDASHQANATRITNNLLGSGVGSSKGWSGTGVVANNGTSCGGTVSQQCVEYHLKPYAVNTNNFLDIYHAAGLLGVPPEIDVGICQGGRDKSCSKNGGMSGTMTADITRTVPVNVTTGAPTGNGTVSELLSAGGMVFVARNGGSWRVPQNPNLASTKASESTNLLLFGNWDIKKDLTGFLALRGKDEHGQIDTNRLGPLQAPGTPDQVVLWSGGNDANQPPVLYSQVAGYNKTASGSNWQVTYKVAVDGASLDTHAKTVMNAIGATSTMEVNGINLGSSRVEGMAIQHLKVTTLGAAN